MNTPAIPVASTPSGAVSPGHRIVTELCTTWHDGTHWFPLARLDDGSATGPGHQNKAAFAEAVHDLDRLRLGAGLVPLHCAEDVVYDWALVAPDGITLVPCGADTPGAVPVTVIW